MARFARRAHIVAGVVGLGMAVAATGCGSSGTATKAAAPTASLLQPVTSGQVTVTFSTSAMATDVLSREVTLIKQRIDSEKLSGVTVSISRDAQSIVVRGPGADKDQLVMLGRAGVLEFRPVLATAATAGTAGGQVPPGVPADLFHEFVALNCRSAPAAEARPTAQIVACQNDGKQKFLLDATAVSGKSIKAAGANLDQNGIWRVDVSLNSEGASQFGQLTTRLAETADGAPGQVAIAVDGVVYSAPAIEQPITDGTMQISGNFTQATAQSLAAILQGGALPVALNSYDVSSVTGAG